MTYPQNPVTLLIKHRHRADPELLRAISQPMFDAARFLQPALEHFKDRGIHIPSPLEEECQRAVQAYFNEHAGDFHSTWPFVATRTGQTGQS
ncbi:hypothetical protein V6D40_07215 [Corynebacterium sp. Q4381]